MKNWRLNSVNQSAFEKTGPIPRSISKTFEKFKKEEFGEFRFVPLLENKN